MDTRVMQLRIKQWIPFIEEQAKRCTGDISVCGCPSISIRYGDFAIDLGSSVDVQQLPKVLRVIKHADRKWIYFQKNHPGLKRRVKMTRKGAISRSLT